MELLYIKEAEGSGNNRRTWRRLKGRSKGLEVVEGVRWRRA
jgi:hypothetical protein